MQLINEQALSAYINRQVKEAVKQYRPKMVEQKMFDRRAAAKYLGIGLTKFDDERRAGYIKPVFPFDGKTRFYLREDLDQVAEQGKEYRKKAKL